MADGVRITPTAATLAAVGIDSAANRPWCVRDITRPLNQPQPCRWCGHHDVKTYHLGTRRLPDGMPILDDDGTVIVSTTIWERLQALWDNGGFEKVNVVSAPPTQGIVLPTATVTVAPALVGGTP